jgi:Xaa-Pro aminopeptidase
MRRLKDGGEIESIRRAIGVTHEALRKVWAAAKGGMREYELEALITGHYRSYGGTHAFNPIVASGRMACSLHYERNERTIEAGDLVLVDTGVCLDGYNSDITRTFPVDGKFTDRQREVYQAVLDALETANAMAAPGTDLGEIHARTFDVIEKAGFGEYFVHGTSHFLGIETHDVGDRFRKLEPGAVFTVEPGIYIPDEGIGVRIEDVVAVTPDGCDVLSEAIPKTVADLETLF